ncbi:penicillin-binding transpeptidase domain-containing protein [Streptomyces sp. LHD-70]|uniref:penicillin-binding transpeptidase domain-containing protein n=1 Tax=Streptomyces sp. LHD-70 TaxID=3072140 RepID=UPI00280FA57F|nr:penicillin-binding transpeptidase domain-containing protein [Streptomyces sp. LHD-70]MDQ8706748.1 penicillin-binding transpeptidase domain-containing protein [Streptomyces sp. LHD-70]
MRGGAKLALVGGVFAAMVGTAGYGAYVLVGDAGGGSGDGKAAVRSGPPDRAEVRETAEAFLTAWAEGDAEQAASHTDFTQEASRTLDALASDAGFERVQVKAGTPKGRTVPFSVTATVRHEKHSEKLRYDSELRIVRGERSGRALVDWKPSVVHPELREGDALRVGEAPEPPIKAVDRDGIELKRADHPSLGPILDTLRERYGDRAGGTPGVELWVERAGESTANDTLLTLAEGRPGELRTTLSAKVQAAAEQAVARYADASVVALRPSSGEILAVANHREDGFNAAFLGKLAPGSTMKIVSAAMLIDKGLTSENGKAPCPETAVWQSQRFPNLRGLAPNGNGTLSDGFARSCNTAFVKFADDVRVDDLRTEARRHFGIGADWKTGVVTFDGSVPASGGPDTAAAMLGQGQVQLNPLNLASIAATVKAGAFRQPVIVPRSLDDRTLATATPLNGSTADQLRRMMRRTALSGTGARAMAGLGGDIGAKTGSAEVDGQERSDSAFTAYRGDVAAAAMVQKGGHGGDVAGPIVAEVLRAGG